MTPRKRQSPFLGLGLDRFSIFVPAIMGLGASFWLFTTLWDMLRWRRDESLARRATTAGRGAAHLVGQDAEPPDPDHIGLRHRGAYLVIGSALVGLALYVFFGSFFNYRRDGGYLEYAASVLAVACIVSALAAVAGLAALITWLRWPKPPRWVRALDRATLLSRAPLDLQGPGHQPDWRLTAATLLVPTAGIILSFLVMTNWRVVVWIDEHVVDLFDSLEWAAHLDVLDPMGSTLVAVPLVALIAIASLRCRPLALSFPAAVLGVLVVSAATGSVVRHEAPDVTVEGQVLSFPSSNLALATLIAGLAPLGVAALIGNRRWIMPLRIMLGLGVVGGLVSRIHRDVDWPSDAIGGVILGLTFVLAVQWAIEHQGWHQWCRGCAWAPANLGPPLRGLIPLHVSVAGALRLSAHLTAAAAVTVLTTLTLTVGVPLSEDGVGWTAQIQRPVQLALAGLVSVGALISWKWEGVGAVLMAVGGGGLGIFGAAQYEPTATFALTVMLVAPAALLWLSWQHRQGITQILVVAAATAVLLGGTWAGASQMYDYWLGPTHPDSAVALLPVDRVEWVWLGGLDSNGVSVSTELAEGRTEAVLVVAPATGGTALRSAAVRPGSDPAARLRIDDLEPGTTYHYHLEVDGVADAARGTGTFRTPAEDGLSFTVAVGACARTGTNGAVFDAIRAIDPLFMVHLGDLHYSDVASSDPADHRAVMRRFLMSPGPAALARTVPMAYVWDDHDYGPNDGDSTSPSRSAVRSNYRDLVPHYQLAVPDEGPINQAFTIGRVRFVVTDSRSERTDDTMLGERQLAWLLEELTTASRTHGLVVWGNSVPWIGESTPGGDSWNGYAAERQVIADALAEAGVDNLIMISGDAHMVAIDDGSNTDYSTRQVGGFPLLQAGALDRRGSVKGGPYSSGTFPGGGRFGTLEVVDDGTEIAVTLAGRSWNGDVFVEETFVFAGNPAGPSPS